MDVFLSAHRIFITQISSLLIENELDMEPFSMSALTFLPDIQSGEDWSVPCEEISVRRDLRNIPDLHIYSVDPPGCQDIDDTMHARGKAVECFSLFHFMQYLTILTVHL